MANQVWADISNVIPGDSARRNINKVAGLNSIRHCPVQMQRDEMDIYL